jgi:hypothetical protein
MSVGGGGWKGRGSGQLILLFYINKVAFHSAHHEVTPWKTSTEELISDICIKGSYLIPAKRSCTHTAKVENRSLRERCPNPNASDRGFDMYVHERH